MDTGVTITHTLSNRSVEQALTVEAATVTVTDVTVSTPPIKTMYQEGDALDLTGLVITLMKSDGTTEEVGYENFATRGITVSKEHGSILTTMDTGVTITHTLSNRSVEQALTVEAATVAVTDVTVSTPPIKTTYQEGDTLDLTGLAITLTKSDGTTEEVGYENFATRGITVSKEHGSILTTMDTGVTITHTLSNRSVEQALTVEAATVAVTDVTVSTPPIKTTYQEGDTLDLTGLVITLTKSDGTTEEVGYENFATKGIAVSKEHGTILTTMDTGVTITHTLSNRSVEQAITVKAPTVAVTDVTVSTPPIKTTYQEGETLDLTGLAINLTKSDGTTEEVGYENFATKGITVSKEHGSTLTTTDTILTITHTLSNRSVEQAITVTPQ